MFLLVSTKSIERFTENGVLRADSFALFESHMRYSFPLLETIVNSEFFRWGKNCPYPAWCTIYRLFPFTFQKCDISVNPVFTDFILHYRYIRKGLPKKLLYPLYLNNHSRIIIYVLIEILRIIYFDLYLFSQNSLLLYFSIIYHTYFYRVGFTDK